MKSQKKVPRSRTKRQEFPPGWDERRVRKVLAHYENQTEDEALAEDEAAHEAEGYFGRVFRVLRAMDAESKYRLRGYQDHVAKRCDEPPITRDLAARLSRLEIPSGWNYYPGTREECDIVSKLQGGKLWLEAKVVYTLWFEEGHEKKTTPSKRREKLASLADDWNRKLCTLGGRDAAYIAALLIAFEEENNRLDDSEIEEFQVKLNKPWILLEDSWETTQENRPQYKFWNRVFVWYRKVD